MILTLACGVVVVWLSVCIYRLTLHPLAKFPGPKLAACSSWYYLYYISGGRFPEQCDKLFARYKSSVIRVGPHQILFNDPRALRDIVGRHDVYRGDFGLKVVGFGEQSVGNIKDFAAHRRKRKLLAPAFTNTAVIEQESKILTPVIDKLVTRIEEIKDGVVDVSAYMDFTTIDFIAAMALGADFGMLDKLTEHPYYRLMPNVMRFSISAQAIPEVYQFLLLLYNWGSYLPKSIAGAVDFVRPYLQERLAVTDLKDRHDMMSTILKRNDEVALESEKMYDKELLGEATTVIAGGSDTVATSLTMIFFHLGQHPEIYQQLVSDIRGRFSTFQEITSVRAAELKYLDAVIQESLRVTPTLPGPTWRRATIPIEVADHIVPPHTEVGVARLSIFRHPDAFHDPKTFKPERWIEDLGDNLDISHPFGLGSRSCIGKNIAMVELRVILSKLLWKFDWEPITTEYDPKSFFVLYREPMYMKATARPAAD